MVKKLTKSAKTASARFRLEDYKFDDGCDPRDLLPKKGKSVYGKLLHAVDDGHSVADELSKKAK